MIAGSIVKRRNGHGEQMIIEHIDGLKAHCVWFVENHERRLQFWLDDLQEVTLDDYS